MRLHNVLSIGLAGLPLLAGAAAQSQAPPSDGHYFPIIYRNDFWQLKDDLIAINETTKQLPLRLTLDPMSMMKFTVYSTLDEVFNAPQQNPNPLTSPRNGAQGGGELEELKKMLLTANPFWLTVTIIVTLLHTLFEFLAFSSDVSHWRKKDKDFVGVSLRTIITNVVVQLIVLLYLYDSSEETSFMILMSQGMGLLVEAWKITKVVDIKVRPATDSIIPYRVTFEDKHELSEDEKKTQQYDKEAFRIVGMFAVPLLMAYSVYSFLYKTHKGYWSYVISTLAQAVYLFGFIQLVPQILINRKLKSVAHMPLKAMIFKTLTTVVDDCAAFAIKMPWLHRLACFRDDVVFVILLYQRWIYRVDYSRVNEYGQVAAEGVQQDKDGEVKKAATKVEAGSSGAKAKRHVKSE